MNKLFVAGLALVLIGFFIMAAAPLLQMGGGAQTAVAGCVFLFFIPVCFGAGQPQLAGLAVLVTAAILAALFLISLLLLVPIKKQVQS
ncbi:hypothetical protein TUZN_1512 [Thermoproteus uzoniensis 768-20]|uniref:DUF131 domain-containing protein n=1 Tax=Thermoproteus uzoniensis (strain 768-20) TaxID=999630 RepID=F2L256_THEU7|nr:hypothetical protein [Thermoproteus uzoniensis]AEA12983.1 hypothetical protein TUZN_1512 [Thermoproteus uzoniensis 768-20]